MHVLFSNCLCFEGLFGMKSFRENEVRVTSCYNYENRTAPGPVVGWPPVRSFRKNLATTSKLGSESPTGLPHKVANERTQAAPELRGKGLFVKINMDGVPIGRKVDLKAYNSYEKLSTAVDELFRGLLAGISEFDACLY